MPHPVKAKKSSTARHEAIQGYLFVTPYLIAFTIFTGIPFVSAFVLSFLDVKFITRLDDVHFVAFKNFVRFFSNKEALAALGRTGLYTLIYVPVIMVLSFILAYLLNKGVFWAKGIRSMFFLPYVSNMVAVAVVFQLMLGPRRPLLPAAEVLRRGGPHHPPAEPEMGPAGGRPDRCVERHRPELPDLSGRAAERG